MKYLKLLFTLTVLMIFVGVTGAQEETKKERKKREKVEAVPQEQAGEVEDMTEVMKPKSVEFQEPAFATDIEQSDKANSAGIYNSYSVQILNADKKVVDKAWKSLMKTYKGKTKYNRKEAELNTSNAKVTELGNAVYTIKASIEETGSDVVVHSWFEGSDGYVDAGSDIEDNGINELLADFAVQVRKDMVKLELGKEEKTLKQSENELSKLKRQNESYHKAIAVAERKIEEAEQNIIENEAAQESAVIKIDGQRTIVESVRQRLKRIN